MDDRIEEGLRRALADCPRPRRSAAFATNVLQRIAAGQAASEQRLRRRERMLLGIYWLVAGIASASLLVRFARPSWIALALGALGLASVPLGYAAFLWPGRIAAWLVLWARPLLAEPAPGRR